MSAKAQPAATVEHELGVLPKLISLPRTPTWVKWQNDARAGGQAGRLRVLLRFSPEDHAYVVEHSKLFERRGNELLDPVEFAWIDEAAKVGIETAERRGRVELLGVEPRQANLFAEAELSPYVNGKLTPLPDGYIFVSMYAM
jgi:hypothetical protein